jgi:ankyrin repeat protein
MTMMPDPTAHTGRRQFVQRQAVAALTLALCVLLIPACRKPSPPAKPAIANPSPTLTVAMVERTAAEVALIEAAVKGDTGAVKELLDRGTNPNTKDPEGRTPLTEAAYYGHTSTVKLLLDHGADVFAKKVHGETALEMAAAHPEVAQIIKREIDLLAAATKNDNKLVKELLDQGAHASVRDPEGRTPLTEAVWNNNPELVSLLIERGASVNTRKNDGATPLSIAPGKGYKQIIERLRKAGAK